LRMVLTSLLLSARIVGDRRRVKTYLTLLVRAVIALIFPAQHFPEK